MSDTTRQTRAGDESKGRAAASPSAALRACGRTRVSEKVGFEHNHEGMGMRRLIVAAVGAVGMVAAGMAQAEEFTPNPIFLPDSVCNRRPAELVHSRLSQSDWPVPAGMPSRIRLSIRLAICGVPQLLHGPVGGLALGNVPGTRDTAIPVCDGERRWRMLHGSYRRRERRSVGARSDRQRWKHSTPNSAIWLNGLTSPTLTVTNEGSRHERKNKARAAEAEATRSTHDEVGRPRDAG